MAARSNTLLALNFSSILWKGLTQDVITEADVTSIDLLAFKEVKAIQAEGQAAVDAASVEKRGDANEVVDLGASFVVMTAECVTEDLCPDGQNKRVTTANYEVYIRLHREFKLSEFDAQINAIRAGFYEVFPQQLASVLHWAELECKVSGSGFTVKQVAFLESITEFQMPEKYRKMYFDMLRNEFDDSLRSRWLYFVSGRSRLPQRRSEMEDGFAVTEHYSSTGASPDTCFPVGHTCSYSVEMPKYSDLETMTRQCTKAMVWCSGIDGD